MSKQQRQATEGTGNLAADAILAALLHYKRFRARGIFLKEIRLSTDYWRFFLAYMQRNAPAEISAQMELAEAVEFKDITIRKGSILQVENMVFDTVNNLN